MAVEIATGYVSIVPSLKGFGNDLVKQLDPSLAAAGTAAGEKVAGGFEKSLSKNLGNVGAQLTKFVTLPLAGIAAAGIKVASEFESSMSQVAQATGLPKEQVKDLSDLAKQLGADTQFSANQAAQAMVELAKGGFTPAEIKAGALKTAMDLAAAGQLDLKTAANLTVSAMGAFGLEAKDASQIADALAGAANASSSDVSDLSQALTQVGAGARQSGMSIQETTAALAALADAGIKGSDAGTSLKTMLMRLQPSTKAAATAMDELGLMTEDGRSKFVKANGEYQNMERIAGLLQEKLGGLSEAEKTKALQTIFGTDAYRAAAVMMDQGAAGLAKYQQATEKAGAAQEAANANLGPTAKALEQAKGAAETAGLAIGEALAPVVQKLAEGAQALFGRFSELSPGMQTAIATFGGLAAAAGPVLVVVSKLVTAFTILKNAQLLSTAAMVAGKIAWVASQAVYIAQVAATAAVTVAQWALNAALTANPIGLVVVAVAALVAGLILLWKKNETFREIVLKVWEAIKTAAGAVFGWIKDFIIDAWNAIKDVIDVVLPAIQTVIEVVWDAIKTYVTTYVKAVWTVVKTVFEAIKEVVDVVWPAIQKAIEVVWDAIKTAVTTYVTAVKTVIDGVWTGIKTATQAAWAAIKAFIIDPIVAVKDRIKEVIGAVRDWLGGEDGVWAKIKDQAAAAWDNIKDAVVNPVVRVKERIQEIIGNIRDWLGGEDGVWAKINDTASTAWTELKRFIIDPMVDAKNRVVDIFDTMVTKVGEKFGGLKKAIATPIAEAFTWVNSNVITPLNDKILDKFGDLKIPKLPVPNVTKLATGGWVRGPGTGTSDSVPALLSNGEFVVNAKAAARNASLLQAINGNQTIPENRQAQAQSPWEAITGVVNTLFRKGGAAAVNMIGRPAIRFLDGMVGGTWGGDLAVAGLTTMIDSISAWADKQSLAPTKIMDALAVYFENMVGTLVGVSTCLRNVNAAMAVLEARMGFRTNGWLDARHAVNTTDAVAAAGLMKHSLPVPRGGIMLWDEGVGNRSGHIAVSDGRGNFLNNFGGAYVERLNLQERGMAGYRGWTPPESFIVGKYDSGGYLQPGWNATYNGTGRPEPVLTSQQWDALVSRPGVTNNWTVTATTVPTEEATVAAWRRWEALQVI